MLESYLYLNPAHRRQGLDEEAWIYMRALMGRKLKALALDDLGSLVLFCFVKFFVADLLSGLRFLLCK